MLMRVSIPVEVGNAAAKAGTLGPKVEKVLADLKAEAACFLADDNGQRSGSIVLHMKGSSEVPAALGALVSGLQRKSLVSAHYESTRSSRGRSIN
jgi:hypothetical protein